MEVMRGLFLPIVTSLLVLISTACDPFSPIYIRNDLSEPVLITVIQGNGESAEDRLEPGQTLGFMHQETLIKSIQVSSETQSFYIGSQKMQSYFDRIKNHPDKLISIELDGLRLKNSRERR